MNKYLSAGLTLAAIGIVAHNDITGTYKKIADGSIVQHNMEAYRIHLKGEPTETFAAGKDRNLQILQTSYKDSYLCASKKDLTKCKVRPENEL